MLLNDNTDVKPDKASMRRALAVLHEAGPDDTAVLFLASHGFSDQAGNYFFMARDNRLSDVNTVIQVANAVGKSRPCVVSSGPPGPPCALKPRPISAEDLAVMFAPRFISAETLSSRMSELDAVKLRHEVSLLPLIAETFGFYRNQREDGPWRPSSAVGGLKPAGLRRARICTIRLIDCGSISRALECVRGGFCCSHQRGDDFMGASLAEMARALRSQI